MNVGSRQVTGATRVVPGDVANSYLIRKLAYQEALVGQVGKHLRTFAKYPAKLIVGINV